MSIRIRLFLASAAITMLGAPAAAHEGQSQAGAIEAEQSFGGYEGEWSGHWQDGDTWRGMWNGTFTTADGALLEGRYIGTFVGEGEFVSDDGHILMLGENGWHEDGGDYGSHHRYRSGRTLGASPDGRLAYSLAEREGWLADCRVLMASAGGYYDYDDYYRNDAEGGLIGGLLGAVAGGFAGNRIADGDRLAGTLIGAGVGGVAGAVIGSLIDSGDDEFDTREVSANELYAARYCDAYLRRYEMSGSAGFQPQLSYGQPVRLAPTIVAAPRHGQHRHGPDCTTTIREEWVEAEAPDPQPRPARRAIPPREEPGGKTIPIG